MNEQDTSEPNKLMIVEPGKKEKRGQAGASAGSSVTSFERQIIGRHVVYKGADGSKLRSAAEARRYFKQKGLVFVESQFDFTPPVTQAAVTTESSPSTPSGTMAVTGNRSRGRPKRPERNAVSPSKSSPPKAATTRRRELADDLKTIRNALKTEDTDVPSTAIDPNAAGPETLDDTKSEMSPPKRRRGRPARRAGSSASGVVQLGTSADSATFDNASATSEDIGREEESEKAMISESNLTTPEEMDGSKTRPSRQRRPNQRYTDLISETEVARKRNRKRVATNSPPVTGASTRTLHYAPSRPQTKRPLPKVSVEPAAPGTGLLKVVQMELEQRAVSKTGVLRTKVFVHDKKAKSMAQRSAAKKQLPAHSLKRAFQAEESVPGTLELNLGRDVSLSPQPPGEFEAPPEFVEIQERPLTPQEEQLPPILPAIPSVTLPSASAVCGETTEMILKPPEVSSDQAKRVEVESSAPFAGFGTIESQAEFHQPEELPMAESFQPQIRRGRQPSSGAIRIMPRDSLGRTSSNGRSNATAPFGKPSSGTTSSAVYGIRRDRETTADGAPLLDINSGHRGGQQEVRGIAKLQQKDSRKIMIGRYGSTSVAASMAALCDPPPELEEYGYTTANVTKKQRPHNVRQQQPSLEASDPSLFCHLPPEVVSDHCYGRQPGASSSGDVQSKPAGKVAPVSAKGRSGHPLNAPPPLEPAETYSMHRPRRMQHAVERFSGHRQPYRTPSPPPYQYREYEPAAYRRINISLADLSASRALSSTIHDQDAAMLSDKLPANILEDDD